MKNYKISIVGFVLAIVCMIAYRMIGSEVLEDGTLVEPFFLIPIGYLFLFISIVSFLVIFFSKFFPTRKLRPHWPLGFLGLLSFLAIPQYKLIGWMGLSWVLWSVWFLYFLPVKNSKNQ